MNSVLACLIYIFALYNIKIFHESKMAVATHIAVFLFYLQTI